jgi:hypothetical protein
MKCNIDRRGKLARLIYGIVLLAIGLALLFAWAVPASSAWAWAIAIACILGGIL